MDHQYPRPEPNIMDSSGLEMLDEIFLKEMNLLQDCLRVRTQLARALQIGFHSLAKARYIMGKHRVSSAQLPGDEETITATSKVTSMLPSDSDCYYFDLTNNTEGEDMSKRSVVQKDKEDDDEEKKRLMKKDPLRWFGVLVPQELKLAQTTFKRCTELSVDVVNLQTKIEHTSQQFWSIVHTASSILYEDEP